MKTDTIEITVPVLSSMETLDELQDWLTAQNPQVLAELLFRFTIIWEKIIVKRNNYSQKSFGGRTPRSENSCLASLNRSRRRESALISVEPRMRRLTSSYGGYSESKCKPLCTNNR